MATFGIKVKVCGITNLIDAETAVKLGADAIGFVFAKSPRQIGPKKAARIIDKLDTFENFTGVFVNTPAKSVKKITQVCKLNTLQFHGEETPEYCGIFKKQHKVFKAFRIKDRNSLKLLRKYDVDGYLLDTYVKGAKGGTGKTFNWQLAKEAKKLASPVILSGGLNPENVAGAIKKARPYMVDVSSGVESSPGKKDVKLIKAFINAVRGTKDEGERSEAKPPRRG